jgi:outer membrane protein TolC
LVVALQLAGTRPIDVNIAARQVEISALQYDKSRYLFIPNLDFGGDYYRHDGTVQNFGGDMLRTNRSSLTYGAGPSLIVGLNDAIFSPLAARQDLHAQQALRQAVTNDVMLAVAEAYFTVQQSRGEWVGALQIIKDAEKLTERTENLAEGLAPQLEAHRARAELARRRQVASTNRERWRVAGAELTRLLRLDPAALVEPVEPSNLTIRLIDPNYCLDDLIAVALTARPELAANQALVQATLQRLRQEKYRPLLPSLLVRPASTLPTGTIGVGVTGGGTGGNFSSFGGRMDYDVQVIWELQNLGLGNRATIKQRRSEHDIATMESYRTQDRIAAEVTQAYSNVIAAGERLAAAEPALKDARESLTKNLEGMMQTRRAGNVLFLVVRPAEVVNAVQAMGQANTDYFAAVADFNRAQFRLYRALGHPSQCLAGNVTDITARGAMPEVKANGPPAAEMLRPVASRD